MKGGRTEGKSKDGKRERKEGSEREKEEGKGREEKEKAPVLLSWRQGP